MNKKLIKTIGSVSCGLGIASSIPFISTSCGSSKNFTLIIKDVPNEISGLVGVNNLGSVDALIIENGAFKDCHDTGIVEVCNGSASSSVLLEKLKNKGLPAGWTAA